MTSFNVMSSGRAQVLVDEQQLQQVQAELKRRGEELERLKSALETLSAANNPARFLAAAMALCNELASRWKAQRVGIGFLKGRYVRLRALSHTERITRHMQLVQDIESTMEECLDQDVEILYPPPKEASFVYRATEHLSNRHGPSAILSLPLRRPLPSTSERLSERPGNVVGVLTMERQADKPLTLAEIESLRLTCDLLTSRLYDLYEQDRWIGAKLLRGTRKTLAWALGAKHTWAKAAAVAVSAFVAYAVLVDGTFRVEAPFQIQAIEKKYIPAPFEGQLRAVFAGVDDMVFTPATATPFEELAALSPLAPLLPIPRPASILAQLDTAELRMQLLVAQGERDSARRQADIYRADPEKRGEVQYYETLALKHDAVVKLHEHHIVRASITSPIDGVIFQGDLHDKVGAPLQAGDLLYVVGQRAVRAELSVTEDQIGEVRVGQTGYLRTTANPGNPIAFTVERVNPVANPDKTENVFKVRVSIDDPGISMAEGVEGLAKIDIRKEPYGWIWTHRMINWIRMKLWL